MKLLIVDHTIARHAGYQDFNDRLAEGHKLTIKKNIPEAVMEVCDYDLIFMHGNNSEAPCFEEVNAGYQKYIFSGGYLKITILNNINYIPVDGIENVLLEMGIIQ